MTVAMTCSQVVVQNSAYRFRTSKKALNIGAFLLVHFLSTGKIVCY